MPDPVKVSVIVLNWNGWQDTLPCLESLAAVKDPPFSVYIVDNGSTDGSVQKVNEYLEKNSLKAKSYQLIANEANLGFAGGNNVGIREALKAGAELIVLLNNDTKVDPGFLHELTRVAQKHQHIGMLNPKILQLENTKKRFWFIGGDVNWLHTRGTHRFYNAQDTGQFNNKEFLATDYATGCCILVKREVIEEIGLMSEDYFLYSEDVEWSLHARTAGWQCAVAPHAVIWHKGGSATGPGSPLYFRYHVRNGLLLALKTNNLTMVLAAFSWSLPRACWQGIKWLLFPAKRPTAQAILFGIRDAWLHRIGKIEA